MRTLGRPSNFREVAWDEILGRFRAMERRDAAFRPMADIVRSVIESGADRQLAGLTSMTDLVVVTRPIPEPPMDEVIVRYERGRVQIEQWPTPVVTTGFVGQQRMPSGSSGDS